MVNQIGRKSSGKRKKCRHGQGTDRACPAMASPSGSGYCSYHEMQALEVGESTSQVSKCKNRDCTEAAAPGLEYCQPCAEWQRKLVMGEATAEEIMMPGKRLKVPEL